MQSNKSKILLSITFVLAAAGVVLLIAWTTGPFYYHFASSRLVSIYSFFQLFATAYIAFSSYKTLEMQSSLEWRKNPSARPFLLSALGFLFLGFDDIVSLHENIDKFVHLVLRIKETAWTDHIDDFILLAYGLVAIFFVRDFIREFRKHPYMLSLILCGLFLFFISCCLDFISNNEETFSYFFKNLSYTYTEMRHTKDLFKMIEESFELLSEAVFFSAFVAAFVNIKTRQN